MIATLTQWNSVDMSRASVNDQHVSLHWKTRMASSKVKIQQSRTTPTSVQVCLYWGRPAEQPVWQWREPLSQHGQCWCQWKWILQASSETPTKQSHWTGLSTSLYTEGTRFSPNTSLPTLPGYWTLSLFKKGGKQHPANYRPVSLTTSVTFNHILIPAIS